MSVAKRLGESDPELTATVEDAIAGDAIACAISREPGEDVGTYAITVQPGDNPDYEVEALGATLTINPSETPEPTEAQRPTAGDGLAYTGGPQELLTEPAQPIEGYAVVYSTDAGTTWPDRVPTGTDAGTYTVRVRCVGDESHESFEAGELTVTIASAAPVVPTEAERPKAMDGLTFDGGEQALVEAPDGVPEGYTVEYSTDGGQTWSKDVPTGKNAGTYDVKVRYAANDDNHDSFEGTISRSPSAKRLRQRPRWHRSRRQYPASRTRAGNRVS